MNKDHNAESIELLLEHVETLTAHTVVQREVIIMMLGVAAVREQQPEKLVMQISEMVREGIIGQEYIDPAETSFSEKVDAEIERIQTMVIEGLDAGDALSAKLANPRGSSASDF